MESSDIVVTLGHPGDIIYEWPGEAITTVHPELCPFLGDVFGHSHGSLSVQAHIANRAVGVQQAEPFLEFLDLLNTNVVGAELLTQFTKVALDFYQSRFGENKSKIGHLSYLVVDPEMRGKGIGKTMVKQVLDIFKKMGFERVVTECTGKFSAGVMEACGFVTLKEIPYEGLITIGSEHKSYKIVEIIL